MICGTFTMSKVPAAELDEVMEGYRSTDPKPTSVSSAPDGAGTYKVTAVYPACSDTTTHSVAGA